MTEAESTPSILPIHIEETIEGSGPVHSERHAGATRHRRVVDRATSFLGRSSFIACLIALTLGWLGLNGLAPSFGHRPLDPAPFPWLEAAVSVASLDFVASKAPER